ncbi:hypothetical protein LLE49_08300 [Alicyclobacillus tolerans]|uniref:hypothetical protein n=1 Tax=Alicyclobacillus tolerans TaxID=90970 RepID=UPI001F192A84|nr:hypothetical protein [Alicyclobacillus tolerans]MCF8564727.1 hypothetical protein [Alicyclobacillus tolerans]
MEQQVLELSQRVHQLEQQGMEISSGWYNFAPAERTELEQLTAISEQSLKTLEQLSEHLSAILKTQGASDDRRQSLQYAYNLVQELMQSRQANMEMLHTVLAQNKPYNEYLRALAVKEKAAASQTHKLQQTLVQLQ